MFVGYTNDSFFPKQILIFRMLRNISSLGTCDDRFFNSQRGPVVTCGETSSMNEED